MSKRDDFLLGFLQGLYQSGVGNPEVNRQRREDELTRSFQQQQLDISAKKQGMMPVSETSQPQSTAHKIASFIHGVIFPGSRGSSLATKYVKDPNAPQPLNMEFDPETGKYTIAGIPFGGGSTTPSTPTVTPTPATPTLQPSTETPGGLPKSPSATPLAPATTTPPGALEGQFNAPASTTTAQSPLATEPPRKKVSIPLRPGQAATILTSAKGNKQKNVTLVYDQRTQKPRIEPLGYQPKPGELAEEHEMGDALSKMGSFTSQEGRTGFFEARTGQIGVGIANDFQKDIDPSELPPTSVMGRTAQSISRAVNGLVLAEEGKPIPKATYDALKGDIDVIVSQASATVEGRKMLDTPNIIANMRNLQSFFSTTPGDVPMPENIVRIYRDIVKELGTTAQVRLHRYIDDNYKLKKGAYSKFLSRDQMDAYVQSTKDRYDIGKTLKAAGVQTSIGKTPKFESDKEMRYQAWKKAHGYQ